MCGECKVQKEGKIGENNRKDDYEHKKGFDTKKEERKEKKVIIVGRIKYDKSSLRIAGVYANGYMKKKLEELKKWLEEWEEGVKTIIGGISTQEGKERERNPKDSKKQRRENVGKGDKGEEMDDYEWQNKGR